MTSRPIRLDAARAAPEVAKAAAPAPARRRHAIRTLLSPDEGAAHLLCIPWAGASIERFYAWKPHLPAGVGLSGVQLPGRGARADEPAATDLDALLDEIALEYLALAAPPPVLFGHSFGALIAYELAMRVNHAARRASGIEPVTRLVVSGLSAPPMIAEEKRIAHLDDAAFSAAVHSLNGMPAEIAQIPASMRYFMNVLRDDFRLYESYVFRAGRPRLRCPIVVCSGRADPSVTEHGLRAWATLTEGPGSRHDFDGDHFYIERHAAALAALTLETANEPIR
ncbi:thioesterase II family protein [Burkholderia glumae]|uniref:Alpha/beta fold hydrolase n=1 Tax=Burkholderia glumae TaxID=337 RepID=A0AAQ0BVK0_BURGL|nr:alpha/beta fold hydrolase [Burkholderia glumae]ACR28834.1 thioesterase II [Burkholderia glumae BGR1]AJY66780.1 thioesterase domain protein [Burkholderia glumae LMG 2196 = ATCC 33617]KHJ63231.1 thioesterase [Burkholderia glumae]MCM2483283.1 alpha/beta fold hydrolase [Burkholderia glumae]MCM2506600.1 alpha/beta fold hydrolase [Burkholderia glumae]